MTPAEESKDIARRGLSKASALLSDAAFAWFLAECVGKRMEELDVILHDPKKDAAEREKALQRWDELNTVKNWTREQRAMFQRDLGHAVTQD